MKMATKPPELNVRSEIGAADETPSVDEPSSSALQYLKWPSAAPYPKAVLLPGFSSPERSS